jgi:integrase
MEKIKYFTQKELKKLFRSIERQKNYPFVLRDLAMFNIGYLCGLRVSEIGRLHQEHFNEPGGELFCMRLKNSISNTIRLDDKRKALLKNISGNTRSKTESHCLSRARGIPFLRVSWTG